MLILSRKLGEAISLPELGITIEVVAVKGSRVQLGINAPREVAIRRGELPPVASPNEKSSSVLPAVNETSAGYAITHVPLRDVA